MNEEKTPARIAVDDYNKRHNCKDCECRKEEVEICDCGKS